MDEIINPINRDELRQNVRNAIPFPYFCIDNFLNEKFANEVLNAFPKFEDALKSGQSFKAVNEMKKVQLTDSSRFPPPIAKLNQVLLSKPFVELMSYVFDIPDLEGDEKLIGGGMHQTGPRGFLDVHIDFNYIPERKLHRRLNILVYFNKDWHKDWGGEIELWDKDVEVCHFRGLPIFNRCVVFETSEISNHGVTAVKCPPNITRKSFAAYYYTQQAPRGWDGTVHSTIFKARPDEKMKRYVYMPLENAKKAISKAYRDFKNQMKSFIKR